MNANTQPNDETPADGRSASNGGLGLILEKMQQVGETLLGTCESADKVIQDVFEDESLTLTELPIEALHRLDEIAMECQVCNWWFEPHELNDDQVCDDCA